ncbi:unnamed protein product [Cyclocybe aegerita]|uniref:Uncharacterized protein n=1 Tax=Cyclocybe aegerita TaxID=1973307 RepID=A0A8S0W4V0_CYCAE|nr:unnamed protein product [Cyclocybe aegerita]
MNNGMRLPSSYRQADDSLKTSANDLRTLLESSLPRNLLEDLFPLNRYSYWEDGRDGSLSGHWACSDHLYLGSTCQISVIVDIAFHRATASSSHPSSSSLNDNYTPLHIFLS